VDVDAGRERENPDADKLGAPASVHLSRSPGKISVVAVADHHSPAALTQGPGKRYSQLCAQLFPSELLNRSAGVDDEFLLPAGDRSDVRRVVQIVELRLAQEIAADETRVANERSRLSHPELATDVAG